MPPEAFIILFNFDMASAQKINSDYFIPYLIAPDFLSLALT